MTVKKLAERQTVEFEYFANDPLNPGFGGTFRVTANGKTIQADQLTEKQAAFVLGRAIVAVTEAREKYPDGFGELPFPAFKKEET